MQAAGRIRIVFFGTPEYAATVLRHVLGDERFDVVLAVTQPDRPAGRGHQLRPSPVKVLAGERGIPVYQPESLKKEEARLPLAEANADCFVVAAYGLIFGGKTLALPRHGCLNLHASLLPAYRGASPITAAILHGDSVTGVTLMRMERGLDTGPMLATRTRALDGSETTESLTRDLAELAGQLAAAEIPRVIAGEVQPVPQPSGASICRPIVKADGWIVWALPASVIERQVRAMWPWPRAYTTLLGGEALQIHASRVVEPGAQPIQAGRVQIVRNQLLIGTGDGVLEVVMGQLPGGRPLPGLALAGAGRIADGDLLGQGDPPPVTSPIVTPAEESA